MIIGILASIAIPNFMETKQRAVIASMKSDTRNLVSAEEAFFADNTSFAGSIGPVQTAVDAAFVPSTGNVITLVGVTATGWAATVTNPVVAGATPANCGTYVGTAAPPNAAVTIEGSPACW